MTDTNMTDTNIPHSGGGVPQDCGKRMRVLTTRRNDEDRTSLPLWVVVCGFVVCCAVSGTTPVVLGVLVVIVAGSRPVFPFRTRLLSLWALMVLHLGGCGRVGYCQH